MHPPLCPGTEDWFGDQEDLTLVIDGMEVVNEYEPLGRELIARHQCCAWKDRAERWGCVFRRSKFGGWICGVAFEAGHEAQHRAYQWREWERKQS